MTLVLLKKKKKATDPRPPHTHTSFPRFPFAIYPSPRPSPVMHCCVLHFRRGPGNLFPLPISGKAESHASLSSSAPYSPLPATHTRRLPASTCARRLPLLPFVLPKGQSSSPCASFSLLPVHLPDSHWARFWTRVCPCRPRV